MKAEQIRDIKFEQGYSKPNDEPTFIVLREIAAHLAELNANIAELRNAVGIIADCQHAD